MASFFEQSKRMPATRFVNSSVTTPNAVVFGRVPLYMRQLITVVGIIQISGRITQHAEMVEMRLKTKATRRSVESVLDMG